jgi:CRISPR/Cas system-associated exonuclease Cas4 (RecB family)
MTNVMIWIISSIFVIVFGVIWEMVRRIVARDREFKWLPEELRAAKLKYAEQTFQIEQPIALIVRVDRAYALGTEIRLLEFKTRRRSQSRRTDVIELSAQKLAIEKSTGATVSEHGYVLIQDSRNKRRMVRHVQLMEKAELLALAKRREAILAGLVEPRYTDMPRICQMCSYRKECRPPESVLHLKKQPTPKTTEDHHV